MTATTTAGKADNNKRKAPVGTSVSSKGVERVREEECYHLATLIDTCLHEAQRLLSTARMKAFIRCTDLDGETGTLDYDEIGAALREARRCTDLSQAYFHDLIEIVTYGSCEVPPF